MWFKFPEGTEAITVQQQSFSVEARDNDGNGYFRAPDHFAAIILDLPGFTHKVPPEGSTDLADLSPFDPVKDSNVQMLAAKNEALKLENDGLRAAHAEISAERDGLKLKLYEAEQEIERLKNPEIQASQDSLVETVGKSGKK
jgi:hypothetical protein